MGTLIVSKCIVNSNNNCIPNGNGCFCTIWKLARSDLRSLLDHTVVIGLGLAFWLLRLLVTADLGVKHDRAEIGVRML